MASHHDLVYMTSTSSGTPFTTSSVTGFNDFQDVYIANVQFMAAFKDGTNYAIGWCHLNGSNNVVVDEYVFTSTGAQDNTEPTFSGTVDISLVASSNNTFANRPRAYTTAVDASFENGVVTHEAITSGTQSLTLSADILYLSPFKISESGWFYQSYVYELGSGTTGNYRMGLYDIGYDGHPTELLLEAQSASHANTSADVYTDLTGTLSITAVSKANPAVVTYTGTDPSDGQRIYITDVGGMTEINDRSFIIANVNAGSNTFELKGEDSTSHTTYTTGGTVHFPVYISAGEYVLAYVADAAVRFQAYSTSQRAGNGWAGVRTGAGPCNGFSKSYTFAALPSDPMGSGTFTDLNTAIAIFGIMRILD